MRPCRSAASGCSVPPSPRRSIGVASTSGNPALSSGGHGDTLRYAVPETDPEVTMKRREMLNSAAAAAALAATPGLSLAQQQRAVCYNCPPEWADWGGMLRLVNQRLNIAVPPDNKNSGQSLAALIAEKGNPVADFTYLGGQVGPQAREAGVLTPYKPARWNDIPAKKEFSFRFSFFLNFSRSTSQSCIEIKY